MVANIQGAPTTNGTVAKDANGVPLEWDWDIEHADRKLEAKADAALHGATPFEVDRRVLKDVVLEHMRTPVVRIVFLGAGTFHKVVNPPQALTALSLTSPGIPRHPRIVAPGHRTRRPAVHAATQD
jgi:hypothetical protein